MSKRKYPIHEYPREVHHFKQIWRRVTVRGLTTAWSRDATGFYAFLKAVGSIPEGMQQPTVGRLDHSRGYEPGNCEWQSM